MKPLTVYPLADIDDEDLADFFATAGETETRTQIWETQNKDWIEAQAEKAKLRAAQEQMDNLVDGKKKRTVKRKKSPATPAATPAEAASNAVQKKIPNKSEKVNYSGLKMDSLFKRLGQDVSSNLLSPTDNQQQESPFSMVPPTPRPGRRVTALGEIVEPATPNPLAASEATMMAQSGQFIAPVATYRTKSAAPFATPNPHAAAEAEAADGDEGDYYEDGDEGDFYADETAPADEYEAEYLRMKATAADAAEADDYYDDY